MATLSPDDWAVGYNNTVFQVRSVVTDFARSVWLSAESWRDADVDRLVNLILPQVQAGQIQIANLTTAYVAAQAGGTAVPVVVSDILSARKADPSVVYRRPAVQMYTALSNGSSLTEAVRQSTNRLMSIVNTDLQLAMTHQERASYVGGGFEYTVRTLTGRENCALCLIASTQRYRVKDLRPIHPSCDCGSKHVTADYDPGQIINPRFLDQVTAAMKAEFGGVSYSTEDIFDLVTVREHGELGPMLVWKGQKFTGPDQIAA